MSRTLLILFCAVILLVTLTGSAVFAQMGACCFEDGSCEDLTEEACVGEGGYIWIPDEECASDPCPPPTAGRARTWGRIKSRYR